MCKQLDTGDFKYVHNFRNLIKYFLNVQIFGGIIVEKKLKNEINFKFLFIPFIFVQILL